METRLRRVKPHLRGGKSVLRIFGSVKIPVGKSIAILFPENPLFSDTFFIIDLNASSRQHNDCIQIIREDNIGNPMVHILRVFYILIYRVFVSHCSNRFDEFLSTL